MVRLVCVVFIECLYAMLTVVVVSQVRTRGTPFLRNVRKDRHVLPPTGPPSSLLSTRRTKDQALACRSLDKEALWDSGFALAPLSLFAISTLATNTKKTVHVGSGCLVDAYSLIR